MRIFSNRRKTLVCLLLIPIVTLLLLTFSSLDAGAFIPGSARSRPYYGAGADINTDDNPNFLWRNIPIRYPVRSMLPVPTGKARPLPKIQAAFEKESPREKQSRQQKRDAVKKTFVRCWESYKTHAWMSDEVAPISGRARNPFGGWGATLVDSLDTLWIMGMRQDFEHAVAAAANISFETVTSDEINVFES